MEGNEHAIIAVATFGNQAVNVRIPFEIPTKSMKNHDITGYYIHMDCVSAVYMGYRMDEHKKIHIKEIVDRKNQHRDKEHKIVLYDAYIHPKEYKICSKK